MLTSDHTTTMQRRGICACALGGRHWGGGTLHIGLARDEKGRKRSAKDFTIFTFTFFHRKRKQYGICGNKNDAGILVISKTEIYSREHIDNGRNPSK